MYRQLEIPRYLGYGPKALTYKAMMIFAQAKINVFFSKLTLFTNNLVLKSYLSGIYLESWFSWLWSHGFLGYGVMVFLIMESWFSWLWSAQNIEEKKKTGRRKSSKSEEKEKRKIRGKSNSNNMHLWF